MKNTLVTLFSPFTGKKRAVQISAIILLLAGAAYTLFSQYYPLQPGTTQQNTPTPGVAVASPSATPAATHGGVFATVVSVVDGDTIKIEGGEIVRYIGVNTPETVAPNRPVECYGKEASAKNKELVQGKRVELEKDVSARDKYGRLLRFVWIGDTMINEALVREGYAQVSTYPPDVKYQALFVEAQRLAVAEKRGLWSGECPLPPTHTPKGPTSTPSATPTL